MVLFSLVVAKLYIPELNRQKEGSQKYSVVKFLSDEKRVCFLLCGREILCEGKTISLLFLFSLVSLIYFIL